MDKEKDQGARKDAPTKDTKQEDELNIERVEDRANPTSPFEDPTG